MIPICIFLFLIKVSYGCCFHDTLIVGLRANQTVVTKTMCTIPQDCINKLCATNSDPRIAWIKFRSTGYSTKNCSHVKFPNPYCIDDTSILGLKKNLDIVITGTCDTQINCLNKLCEIGGVQSVYWVEFRITG